MYNILQNIREHYSQYIKQLYLDTYQYLYFGSNSQKKKKKQEEGNVHIANIDTSGEEKHGREAA